MAEQLCRWHPELKLIIRRALEHESTGVDRIRDRQRRYVMSRSCADLAASVFPDVTVRKVLGPNETLLSIAKARRARFRPSTRLARDRAPLARAR